MWDGWSLDGRHDVYGRFHGESVVWLESWLSQLAGGAWLATGSCGPGIDGATIRRFFRHGGRARVDLGNVAELRVAHKVCRAYCLVKKWQRWFWGWVGRWMMRLARRRGCSEVRSLGPVRSG